MPHASGSRHQGRIRTSRALCGGTRKVSPSLIRPRSLRAQRSRTRREPEIPNSSQVARIVSSFGPQLTRAIACDRSDRSRVWMNAAGYLRDSCPSRSLRYSPFLVGHSIFVFVVGAGGGSRTPRPRRAQGPKPCASASSATPAQGGRGSFVQSTRRAAKDSRPLFGPRERRQGSHHKPPGREVQSSTGAGGKWGQTPFSRQAGHPCREIAHGFLPPAPG